MRITDLVYGERQVLREIQVQHVLLIHTGRESRAGNLNCQQRRHVHATIYNRNMSENKRYKRVPLANDLDRYGPMYLDGRVKRKRKY